MKAQIAHIYSLLNDIPEQDRPKGDELVRFWVTVAWELSSLILSGSGAKQPELVFQEAERFGRQYVFQFCVNDLSLPKEDKHNWHLQNTSQWKYAGAIVIQDGKVTAHH